jgi:23S rRNA pseudouridine1911/1915/1917 synthase
LKTTVTKSYSLIEYLIEQYPDSPRTRIKKLLQSGTIRINDRPVTLHSYKLKPGDVFEINKQDVIASKAGLPFEVLFEDKDIIVIDKPAGTPTSSTDVSGVLLFAKTDEVMEAIKEKWSETEKHYYALVEGIPAKAEDAIKSWLIEDKTQKVHSTKEQPNAKWSVTNYSTIKIVNGNALLDIKTDTGRKNQIRVHLSDIGCPIIGDRKYGASAEFRRRVRLHAYSLSFPHPVTGNTVTVKTSMPEGFLSLKLRDEKYK